LRGAAEAEVDERLLCFRPHPGVPEPAVEDGPGLLHSLLAELGGAYALNGKHAHGAADG
jgi:hypothetical protein